MKSKSVNFSASNAKRSVKFASVNENSLHAAIDNDCLFTFWANSEWSCERHTGLFAIHCVYLSAFYSLMWMHLYKLNVSILDAKNAITWFCRLPLLHPSVTFNLYLFHSLKPKKIDCYCCPCPYTSTLQATAIAVLVHQRVNNQTSYKMYSELKPRIARIWAFKIFENYTL